MREISGKGLGGIPPCGSKVTSGQPPTTERKTAGELLSRKGSSWAFKIGSFSERVSSALSSVKNKFTMPKLGGGFSVFAKFKEWRFGEKKLSKPSFTPSVPSADKSIEALRKKGISDTQIKKAVFLNLGAKDLKALQEHVGGDINEMAKGLPKYGFFDRFKGEITKRVEQGYEVADQESIEQMEETLKLLRAYEGKGTEGAFLEQLAERFSLLELEAALGAEQFSEVLKKVAGE